jgi:hypothetical protein
LKPIFAALRLIFSGGAVFLLGGCHTVPLLGIVAASGGATWLVTAQSAVREADALLAIAKPIDQAICGVEQAKPHTPEVAAAMKAFCASLPSDVGDVLAQAAAVFAAIDLENHPI